MSAKTDQWPVARLGDICDFKYGKSLPEAARSGGAVPVYGSNGVVGGHDAALTASETIIIGRKGSHGEVNFSSTPCWPIDTTYYVDCTATNADLHWLRYRLAGAGLNQMNRAAAIPGLNREDAYRVEILLPPLPEQRRIAAILDQAETLRTQRRAALAQLDSLTQSLFLDMFGDAEKNPLDLPKAPLGSLIKLKSGNFLPASQMAVDGTFPVYGGNGINGLHDVYMFKEPKIVIGRVGAYCGCVHVTKPCSWVTDNALYLDTVSNSLQSEYLAFALTEARMNQYASQSGQPLISGARLAQIPLLVPPLPLQQTFATRIQAIEALKASHRAALAQLDALFASLQQRAFAGEL